MIRAPSSSLGGVFGWPILIALFSLTGLVAALFWEGPVDAIAALLLTAPVAGAALGRWKRAR